MLREKLPDDLQSHESTLFGIVYEGLALFHARFGALRAGMTVRTERNNIHDCLSETAKKYFPHKFSRNLFLVVLGRYRIKLKKFDSKLQTSNNPTQAVFDFLRQQIESIGSLFSDAKIVNLHLGYIPDGMDITKSSIWITQPQGVDLEPAWSYELRADVAAALAPIPPPTSPVMPDDAKSRVTPKQPKKPAIRKVVDNES